MASQRLNFGRNPLGICSKKLGRILLIAFFTTLLLFSNLQVVQAAPVVTGPYTSSAGAMGGGVRYKAFRNPGRVYLGPRMGSGLYPNRVETGVTWASPGAFGITFTYDKANDRLVTTVGATTLIYPNIGTYAGDPLGSVPPNSWNFLQITIANRGTGTTVNLNNVNLDTYSLGSFPGGVGPTGWQFWQITNYDFSQGFTVTGTIQLAGPSANFGDETCKIEINVGYFAPPPVLDHFTFNAVSSPQTAGSSFSVTVTAKDQYGNTLTSYTGSNTLSASTGPGAMSPTTTGSFSAGVWTGSVTITKAQSIVTITTSGSGKSGTSNDFIVKCGPASTLIYASGDGQTGKCNQECPQYLKVRVGDAYSNPVDGHAVIWEITAYPTDALGQWLSHTNTATDPNGEAYVRFRFGNKPGTYKITATDPTRYTFVLTATSEPPRPVGGIVMPVNKLALLMPYLAFVGLVVAVSAVVVVKKRSKA